LKLYGTLKLRTTPQEIGTVYTSNVNLFEE